MTFAFDYGGTLSRYPRDLWTIMECLARGGHRAVVLSACGSATPQQWGEVRQNLTNLKYDFGHFELVVVPEDFTGENKAKWCRDNDCVMLIDDAPYNMDGLRRSAPQTARIQIAP